MDPDGPHARRSAGSDGAASCFLLETYHGGHKPCGPERLRQTQMLTHRKILRRENVWMDNICFSDFFMRILYWPIYTYIYIYSLLLILLILFLCPFMVSCFRMVALLWSATLELVPFEKKAGSEHTLRRKKSCISMGAHGISPCDRIAQLDRKYIRCRPVQYCIHGINPCAIIANVDFEQFNCYLEGMPYDTRA